MRRVIRARQVAHDTDRPQHALAFQPMGGTAQIGPVRRRRAVTGQADIEVQMDARAGRLTSDRLKMRVVRHSQLDVVVHRRGELSTRAVEPTQDWRHQAGLAQRQRLGQAGHAQPRRAVGQGHPGHLDAAVAEAVGLHHRHQFTAGTVGQQPSVRRDRGPIDRDRARRRRIQGERSDSRFRHDRYADAPPVWRPFGTCLCCAYGDHATMDTDVSPGAVNLACPSR